MKEIQCGSAAAPETIRAAGQEASAGAGADAQIESQKACESAGGKGEEMTDESVSDQSGDVGAASNETAARVSGTVAGGKAKRTKKGDEQPVMIPFAGIEVSQWNESADSALNEGNVADLAKDLKRHGLMHCVTLVPSKEKTGPKYFVLTGWRRFLALKKLRGEDSGLRIGEFKIHDKLNESDEKCMDYSLSENTRRYGRSILDKARFVWRMIKEKGVKEKRFSERYGMRREIVNRLVKLHECEASIPECWLKDLSYVEKPGGKRVRKSDCPRITLTHWVEVAGKVGAKGIGPDVTALMEEAYKSKWKASRLRKELKKLGVKAAAGEGQGGAGGSPEAVEAAPVAAAAMTVPGSISDLLAADPDMTEKFLKFLKSGAASAGSQPSAEGAGEKVA